MSNTKSRYQLLRKGDSYTVRYKGWFGIWWYIGYDGDWVTPEWGTREQAERDLASHIEHDAKRAAFKAAKVEVVEP